MPRGDPWKIDATATREDRFIPFAEDCGRPFLNLSCNNTVWELLWLALVWEPWLETSLELGLGPSLEQVWELGLELPWLELVWGPGSKPG